MTTTCHTTDLLRLAIGHPITKRGKAIFPVFRPGSTMPPLGLSRPGEGFIIREKATPTVPILEVENTDPDPVVLFAGETLEGGRQQRVLNQSVIIPGRSVSDIPVSCVEQGRWHGDSTFRGVGEMAPAEVRRPAHHRDQSAVWGEVNQMLSAYRLASDTDALDSVFVGRRSARDAAMVDEVASWGPLPEQVGIVVMSEGRVVSADVFGDPALLESMWGTLVRSAFTSAVGTDRTSRNRADRALGILRRLGRELRGPLGASDVGVGQWRQVITDRVTGQALALDGRLVHVSGFPTDR